MASRQRQAIKMDEAAEWPIYALADYANSGRLIYECCSSLSLLSEHELAVHDRRQDQGEHEQTPRQQQRSARSANGELSQVVISKRANKTSYCTITSGYQTLEEQQQSPSSNIHQTAETEKGSKNQNQAWLPHRSSERRVGNINRPSSSLNKSRRQEQKQQQQQQRQQRQDKQQTPKGKLLWWHLIERVNYGKLAAEGRQAAGSMAATTTTALPHQQENVMDWELDSLYRTRVMELCHRISQAVSPFLVSSESISAARDISIGRSPSSTHPSGMPTPPTLITTIDGGVEGLHPISEARLRRLSWRRRSRVGPPDGAHQSDHHNMAQKRLNKLTRDKTFSLGRFSSAMGTGRTRRTQANGELESGRRRVDIWLDHCQQAAGNRQLAAAQFWSAEPRLRGRYGESLVHTLLVNHSNEHLILLVLILKLWPMLLFDTFQSDKFMGLSCLHLTIAYGNQRLLDYLLELQNDKRYQISTGWSRGSRAGHAPSPLVEPLVEQRVTGSLFRSPLRSANKSTHAMKNSTSSQHSARFWCDQLEHWPTANGREHLILFDRIKNLTKQTKDDDDERRNAKSKQIYFGQTPLAWSVAFESKDMFELLLSKGQACVDSLDHQGNNCLHLLIINSQQNWTRFLLKFGSQLAQQVNSMQLTPFLLACHLGRVELFNELLELSAVEFWTYSSVKCCAYPLASLDPIVISNGGRNMQTPTGRVQLKEAKSAVSVILESKRSSDEQKSALLSTGVIKKLLEEKWKIFARRLFYADLTLTLLQLLLMTFACFMRTARIKTNYLQELEQSATDEPSHWFKLAPADRLADFLQANKLNLFRNACELLIVAISFNRIWSFSVEWFRYRNLSLQFTYNPLVANLVLANLLVVLCLPIRLAQFGLRQLCASGQLLSKARCSLQKTEVASMLHWLDQLEDFLLILASPLLWSSLLFFVAAFYVTGPFVAMINYMLMRDAKQFSLIYLIFLCSFAQSIFFTNYTENSTSRIAELTESGGQHQEGHHGSELELLADWLVSIMAKYGELWLELFKMTLGVYEFQPFRHSLLSRGLLMLFIHLIPILFNMLIAMMNNTYSLVISQSERAWSFQWARTLFALERRLSDQEKLFYLKKYAINLSTRTSGAGAERSDDLDEIKSVSSLVLSAHRLNETAEPNLDKQFVPGLMIIKQTDCTKAELRRRLVGHWQKSTRRVLENLARANIGQSPAPPAPGGADECWGDEKHARRDTCRRG